MYNQNNPDIVTENGYEVPVRPGVRLNHIMTNNLGGPGTINHVVNGVGDTVDDFPQDLSYVISYL